MAACRGCPPVDDSHLLCVGFLQCGSLVEVCNVDCVLSLEECLVLVRSGYACHAVGVGCARGPPSSVSCLSLPALPRLLCRVVSWVGFLLDVIGGVESVLWEGC